ncbi:hypothetical protein FB45DRAFT_1054276 [Roridomyces roridus]|uniref:DUF6534 domain-containing protein n=1 Tax=Roridomyces roridus TaxID=1738132 RepID=A0AAD7FX21_9AGAR|nr:hypothetical protein FB45DRAFT_1054276 [Roridomyces roridus]
MSEPASLPSIPKTFGAILIGAFFATAIWGMGSLQGIYYIKNYVRDARGIKLLAAVIWVLDSLHTAVIWSAIWTYLIHNYGELEKVDVLPWGIPLSTLSTTFITVLVDSFHAYRIFMLSRGSMLMTAPIGFLLFARLALGTTTAARMFQIPHLSVLKAKEAWLLTVALATSATLDIVTAAVLVHLLLKQRSMGSRFNHVVEKLIIYGLETGSITALASIASMLCWITMPTNFIFLGIYFLPAKLYANSFFTTLNMRNSILSGLATTIQVAEATPVLFMEPRRRTADPMPFRVEAIPKVTPRDIQINVETEQTIHYEDSLEDKSGKD